MTFKIFFSILVIVISLFLPKTSFGQSLEAIPSGMELLYGGRISLNSQSQPLITMGISTGLKTVTISAKDGPLLAEWYDNNKYQRIEIPADTQLKIAIKESRPAQKQYLVVPMMDRLPETATKAIRERWPALLAMESGWVVGSLGMTVDTREQQLAIPCKDQNEAQLVAKQLQAITAHEHTITSRLTHMPWALLPITMLPTESPLGTATSYIRFHPVGTKATTTIHDVDYGHGYGQSGREDRTYRGEIYVAVDPEGQLAIINVIELEELLRGIVPAETFPTAPMEALKAQAVTARSNIIAKLGTRHFTDPFHICGEQHCQVYAGFGKETPSTDEAIKATKGMVIVKDGILVDAVYSSTCGGSGEANWAVWEQLPNKALEHQIDLRGQTTLNLTTEDKIKNFVNSDPEAFCRPEKRKANDAFRWRKTISFEQLDNMVANQFPKIGHVTNLEVKKRGPGGRVITLQIKGNKGTADIGPELAIRRLFGNLKSGLFIVEKEPKNWLFTGAGWGHGVGMCQMGAIGRAKAGQTFEEILSHYYNHAIITKLY